MACPRVPTNFPDDELGRPGKDQSSNPDGPIRVLVVDDDVRVLAAISQTITFEDDLQVVGEACDPTTATALAARTGPSVVLVDVLLPDDTTGLDLVRRLCQRPACAVVAMSVRGGLRIPALAAGARGFVEKGSDIDAVLSAIRHAARPISRS